MIDRKLKFDTLQIHAGQEPNAATGSRGGSNLSDYILCI